MPIYEYECDDCGAQISDFAPIKKMKKTISCPGCKGTAKKIMSRLGRIDGGVTPKFYQ